MKFVTPDLCDTYPELVQAVEPMFANYGGIDSFGGEIVTVKCFEDNSKVKELVDKPGEGKVMVVDAGGSFRCAMLGDMLAEKAVKNGWSGIIMYGCVRDVDILGELELGVQALGVTFGGVTFKQGQYVYADNNGVITSPEPLEMPEV